MAERASKIDISVDNIDDVLTAQIRLGIRLNNERFERLWALVESRQPKESAS